MRLLAIAHLRWKRYLQQLLVGHGLTLPQYYLLRRLSRRESLRPSQIAETLFCDRPTASVVIANLAAKGWLSRERDETNHKQTLVRLTDSGRDRLAALDAAPPTPREPAFDPLACFTPGEAAEFGRLLARLHDHLAQLDVRRGETHPAEEEE
jgi:DNA-binding MarR family transcriptional regulator